MFYYSEAKKSFYASELRAVYEAKGTWPSDATQVSDETHAEFTATPPQGKELGALDGAPAWIQVVHPLVSPQAIKGHITQKRWEVETGGLTLPNGVHVTTGIDDQNRITSVIANARLAALETVSFKAASGWVTLTLAELEGVAAAIAMHVQQCFSAERAHHEAIDALQQLHAEDDQALQQALEAYDVEQGWPTNDLYTPQPA